MESNCCVKIKCNKEKFKLDHKDPDLFHRSEWDPPGTVSNWYLFYRIVSAVVLVSGVIVYESTSDYGLRGYIYMSDQGLTLLAITFVLDAVIVIRRRFNWCPGPQASLPLLYKITWVLQYNSFATALWITLVYWSLLHSTVNIVNTDWDIFLAVMIHLLNFLFCLIDMLISAKPFRLHHFYWGMTYGLIYSLFSLIYYLAGGVGRCNTSCDNLTDVPPVASALWTDSATASCDGARQAPCLTYIYPFLDWGGRPALAVATIVGGCVVFPVLHVVWWLVYRLRYPLLYLYGRKTLPEIL